MNASAGTGVFVLSLMSIPISYLFNSLVYNSGIEAVFYAGATTFVILAISTYFLVKKKALKDPLFYVFAVHAFLSVMNLIIALEQDGIIDDFMTYYLQKADPFINTAHSHMTSYWDGSAHYFMYLLIVTAMTWGASYRVVGLYWTGSFLIHAIVLNTGNVVGRYGIQRSPLFLIHMLHMMLSLWACFRIFRQPCTMEAQPMSIQEAQKKNLLQRPLDFLFALCLIPATIFCVFRGLVALDCPSECCQVYSQLYEPYLKDPSAYSRIQMLVGMLYSGPCYVLCLYGLLVPGCQWMTDLTLVHSGALAQAQFCHIGASLHTRTPFSHRVPADSQAVFLLVNVLYALVPQALCYRCVTSPAYFCKAPPFNKKSE